MSPPELNQAWSRSLVSELGACGIRQVVICPGSRSAPLALAFADFPQMRVWSIVDERSAGFFALGLAKESGIPAALVSTSGTAGANFYPAVVEATLAHVPMLVLTADRPRELHGWGALQTVPQQNFYGQFPRWFVDLGLPEPDEVALRHLRATAARAVAVSAGRPKGVVHLNAPFREPLSPLPAREGQGGRDFDSHSLTPAVSLFQPEPIPRREAIEAVRERISRTARGVIVCGPREESDDFAEAVLELARSSGYPVLAEAASQVRFGRTEEVISLYDALLRHREFAEKHRPEMVLRFGGPLISKVLQGWLDSCSGYTALFSDDGMLADPSHAAALVVEGDAVAACRALIKDGSSRQSEWARSFCNAERRAKMVLQRGFALDSPLTEPRAMQEVLAALPPGANLFVSSSMPVRDLDAFGSFSPGKLRVFSNRGANGIDGVISSALGVAAGADHPTVLVTGDLALWHDLGGLLTAHRHRLSLAIVVLNNDGGGIFSFLPIAQIPSHFEQLFATPHGLSFSSAAELFGGRYVRPKTAGELRGCLRQSLEGGLHLIEVQTDRRENVDAHRRLFDELVASLGEGPWA